VTPGGRNVALPLLDRAAVSSTTQQQEIARELPSDREGPGENRPRVMVVDDDLAMCGLLGAFLGERGYQFVTARNAEEAVKRYCEERPTAVILDVVMPGAMDGLAALAAFKRIDREVPVIVLSGQGHTTTVVQAMKLGALDFISKPFEEADLEASLAARSSSGRSAASSPRFASSCRCSPDITCCSPPARAWPRSGI
jgi:DNA-binding NtrC family response regulator